MFRPITQSKTDKAALLPPSTAHRFPATGYEEFMSPRAPDACRVKAPARVHFATTLSSGRCQRDFRDRRRLPNWTDRRPRWRAPRWLSAGHSLKKAPGFDPQEMTLQGWRSVRNRQLRTVRSIAQTKNPCGSRRGHSSICKPWGLGCQANVPWQCLYFLPRAARTEFVSARPCPRWPGLPDCGLRGQRVLPAASEVIVSPSAISFWPVVAFDVLGLDALRLPRRRRVSLPGAPVPPASTAR